MATRKIRASKVTNRNADTLQSQDKIERHFQDVLGLSTEENVCERRPPERI